MNRWDERYSRSGDLNYEPHQLIVDYAGRIPPGGALDLACGTGRHTIFLAKLGWHVTAVDYSSIAVEFLKGRAIAEGVEIDLHLRDLEAGEFKIETANYDLIVDCFYLQRNLFPAIKNGTKIGGTVISIIPLAVDDLACKTINPAYLLEPGELKSMFEDWEIVHYHEGQGNENRRASAEMVARRLA